MLTHLILRMTLQVGTVIPALLWRKSGLREVKIFV